MKAIALLGYLSCAQALRVVTPGMAKVDAVCRSMRRFMRGSTNSAATLTDLALGRCEGFRGAANPELHLPAAARPALHCCANGLALTVLGTIASMRFFKDLSPAAFTAGFVAVLVGFASSVAIVFQAALAFKATP